MNSGMTIQETGQMIIRIEEIRRFLDNYDATGKTFHPQHEATMLTDAMKIIDRLRSEMDKPSLLERLLKNGVEITDAGVNWMLNQEPDGRYKYNGASLRHPFYFPDYLSLSLFLEKELENIP
jgi:hypothetical protein